MTKTKAMQFNLLGALKELEANGMDSSCYRFFLYGSPDGEEPTVSAVRNHLINLVKAGFVSLPLDEPQLWEGCSNDEA